MFENEYIIFFDYEEFDILAIEVVRKYIENQGVK